MELIYEIDFPALKIAKKKTFVYHLGDHAKASFEAQTVQTNLLAQTLIFTRWWNSYKHMAPEVPTPEILRIAMELLWDFLEGKCGAEEFDRFQRGLSASVVDIMTGDDSELEEDPENSAFHEKYFSRYRQYFYNEFLSELSGLMEGAATGEPYWKAVEYVLYGHIGSCLIDFFEPVFSNPDGGYKPSELDRRDEEIYSTPTFARVIALLQQDMRAALEGTPLAELRARYQNEYLFSPEESAKISGYR